MNLSRGAFSHLAAALGLAMLSTGVRADWLLRDANQQEQHLTINTWTPAEGLSATDTKGKLIAVPTRDILRLSSGQKAASDPASRAWRLALQNGDVLYGDTQKISGK